MDKLKCVIEQITFRNDQNGFSVIRCNARGYPDIVTAVGIMPNIHIGSIFNLYGFWKFHPKYGRQFCFQVCEETLPTTTNGIKKYLGSGLIKGIGPAYAGRIVDHFGKKTIDILDNHPERLAEVPGIGQKRIEKIKTSWFEQKEIKNIMLFLQSYNVSTSLATKIFKHYGNQAIAIVTENPYRLADDVLGIGFKTADTIASNLGFNHKRYERLRSGIIYTLNKLSEIGHCYATMQELIATAVELLDVEVSLINEAINKMIDTKDLIQEDDAIYLPIFYYSELGTAKRLLKLMFSPRSIYFRDNQIALKTSIRYDDTQLNAIEAAINNKVLVLTGGPGTGKTTTTLGIIRAYREAGAQILLAAPTGRAAKRMSEVTGMEAKTIHRLLEMRPPNGFQRNEDNPLKGDILILDECSMIDILLMSSLLKALPDNMTLIMIGDVDQLPSVGPGKVLADIIASGVVPVIRLEKIFRQAQKSKIITNAHKINHGEMPYFSDRDAEFIFIENDEPEKTAKIIVSICSEIINNPTEVQVLTPMRRGELGANNLNLLLQAALNPNTIGLKTAGVEYRLGDKVMQIKNNYEKAVFNGDIGIVSEVNTVDKELTVCFDDKYVIYESSELDELVLAYATTIHKSQGCEFPYVIMPLMKSQYIMLQRNLLYTAVTRAKKGLVIVGERKAVYIAVMNNKIETRNTKLADRLNENLVNI